MKTYLDFIAYSIVFTVFNIITFAIYYLYGNIIYKRIPKRYLKKMSLEKRAYLKQVGYKNKMRRWLVYIGHKIKKASLIYLAVTELLCLFGFIAFKKYILICRIDLLVSIIMIVLWIVIAIRISKKRKRLYKEYTNSLGLAMMQYDVDMMKNQQEN